MKQIALGIVLLPLFLGVPVRATTFGGNLVETITSTDDPLYHVGQEFWGSYWYDSPTVDGTFSISFWDVSIAGLSTLDGRVYLPYAKAIPDDPYYDYGPGLQVLNLTSTPYGGTLIVTEGEIASFEWSTELGGFYTYMNQHMFQSLSFLTVPGFNTLGSIDMSAPQRIADSTATGSLLCGVGLLLVAFRRRSNPSR